VTSTDKASFAIGILSSVIFLASTIPHIVLNCRKKKFDGQSFFFFALSATGSALNLVGMIITRGLITQFLTSVFHLLFDLCLLGQFIAYKYVLLTNDMASDETECKEATKDEPSPGIPPAAVVLSGMLAQMSAATGYRVPYSGSPLIGSIFGWGGACIFIASRIPQILKNRKHGEVRNISPQFVLLTFLGNVTYLASIFLCGLNGSYLWKQTPLIVGASGPMFCDAIVIAQFCSFPRQPSMAPCEAEAGFWLCRSLCRIELPASVEIITSSGFLACISLSEVIIALDSHLQKIAGFR
jgi:uncharacterized protein with PQ loop repeat